MSCNRNLIFVFQIFLEQKKMLKSGLNIAHFKEHVKIIEAETTEYFQRWGDSGERGRNIHTKSRNCSNWTVIVSPHDALAGFHYVSSFLYQTCLKPCPSWSSWQPAVASMGRRSAACWTSRWPSCTPIWTEDSPTLPGSFLAGCPCPASGGTTGHEHICTQYGSSVPQMYKDVELFRLGKGTELTERSRTSSIRWFRSAGALVRKWTTSCRPSLMPHTSKSPRVI